MKFETVARVANEERVTVERIAQTARGEVWSMEVRFGFFEVPNLLTALEDARKRGCSVDLDRVLFFAANDDVVASADNRRLASWRRMVFGFLYRNAVRGPDRFALPRSRFIEIGRQVEL